MVVLEGHNMLGVNGPNQYLSPDYLSPLPTTLDAKKSPLALLVQTCSQIGADSPSGKSLLHPSPLSSSDSTSSIVSAGGGGQKRKASTSSDSGGGSSLKSLSDSSNDSSRPRSSGSTSSTCSSAKQPRLSSHHRGGSPPNGKISPKHIIHQHHNNNNNESSAINHHKMRKLSGQSISSESFDKHRSSRGSPPSGGNSASVIVPQGKHSGSSSVGSRSPNLDKSQSVSKSTESNSSLKQNPSPKPAITSSQSSSQSQHQQDQGQSPIIRSGFDVLQGKDLPKMSSGFGAFGYPPGFDPTNPAFRLPFLASAHAHHAHLFGYPQVGPPQGGNPYLAYSRVKSATGVESIVPVCKDPYCTGCQYSAGLQGGPGGPSNGSNSALSGLMAAAAAAAAASGAGQTPSVCPAGCAQCDHQKFPLIPSSATSGPYPGIPGFPPGFNHAALSGYPQSLLSHPHVAAATAMMQHQQAAAVAAAAQQQQNAQRPYVCNWIVADSYCGKRFPSSEELLQHLRTHTNSSSAAAAAQLPSVSENGVVVTGHPGMHAQTAALYSNALLNSSALAAAMHRTYPTPPLSPHSAAAAARYNPYAMAAAAAAASGKPPGMSGLAPPPQAHPALAGYYPSPYSLYGPRIG